jgi:hypothetical protein
LTDALLSKPTLHVAVQLLIGPRRAVSIAAPNDGASAPICRGVAKID